MRELPAGIRRRRLAAWTSDGRALFDRLRVLLDVEQARSMAGASWVYSADPEPLLEAILAIRKSGWFEVPLRSDLRQGHLKRVSGRGAVERFANA